MTFPPVGPVTPSAVIDVDGRLFSWRPEGRGGPHVRTRLARSLGGQRLATDGTMSEHDLHPAFVTHSFRLASRMGWQLQALGKDCSRLPQADGTLERRLQGPESRSPDHPGDAQLAVPLDRWAGNHRPSCYLTRHEFEKPRFYADPKCTGLR